MFVKKYLRYNFNFLWNYVFVFWQKSHFDYTFVLKVKLSEVKVVGRGIDTLVLNVCYADKQFQPVKKSCQKIYKINRICFKTLPGWMRLLCLHLGRSKVSTSSCRRKGREGYGAGYSSRHSWHWPSLVIGSVELSHRYVYRLNTSGRVNTSLRPW